MLVLVAEQDEGYADLISELLRTQSHRVVLAGTEDSFHQFVDRSTANLIILSASLIAGRPSDMVRELSQSQDSPIIVVFDETGPMEIAACLGAGADDCIRKPFHPSEFAARVEVVARRARRAAESETGLQIVPSDAAPARSVIVGQGLEFDDTLKRAYYHGTDLDCSELEYSILSAMAAVDGQVLSHAFLNARVWGYPNLNDASLLKGHVSSIRRKLKAAGFESPLIRTVYGIGYSLVA